MPASEFSDVFISYRRKNVDFVKQLVDDLNRDGKEVWVDWEDIPPGVEGFADEIKRGIEGADIFLAVLSPDYMESTYCVDMELGYATELNKKIIPVVFQKFDDYEVPSSVSHINWIYFTPHAGQTNTYEEAYPKILEVMHTDLEHVRNHKRLLLRAIQWEATKKDYHFLLSGSEIDPFQDWLNNAAGKEPIPTELQKEFIGASIDNRQRQQRRLLLGVTTALVISIVLSIVSLISLNTAQIARAEAETERANAITEKERAEVAEADALQRAREADARLLADQLPIIYGNDPFVAYALALDLLDTPDMPAIVPAVAKELILQGTALRRFEGHLANVNAVDYSPDGTTIVSGSDDGTLVLWDVETGEMLRQFIGHTGGVLSVEFSPNGNMIASGARDNLIIVWDVETGTIIYELVGHTDWVNDVAFIGNEAVVSASDDMTLIVWDVVIGEMLSQSPDPFADFVTSAAVSADGLKIFVSLNTTEDNVLLIDANANEVVSFVGHTERVTSIVLSPDEQTALSASDDFTLILWDVATGELLRRFEGHTDWVKQVAFSPDGKTALSTSLDGSLILWDVETADILETFVGHSDSPFGVVFSPDGENAVSASFDNSLILWDLSVQQGKLLDIISTDIDDDLSDAELENIENLLPEFNLEASTDASEDLPLVNYVDTTVTLEDAETGDIVEYDEHTDTITGIRYSLDGQTVVSLSNDDTAIIWDVAPDQLTPRFVLDGHTDDVTGALISPDDATVITVSSDNSAILWDIATGELIVRFTGHIGDVQAVAYHPTKPQILTGSQDNTMILWDIESGEPIIFFEGHGDDINGLAFNDDGSKILSTAFNDEVIVWLLDVDDEEFQTIIAEREIVELTCAIREQFSTPDIPEDC